MSPSGLTGAIPKEELEKYTGLWEPQPYEEMPFTRRLLTTNPGIEKLTIDDVRSAARAFKKRTSQTYDGFHVRQWAMLSDQGTECLAQLLYICIRLGTLPRQHRLVTMMLLPKSSSGNRVVAAFTSLYRLAMRLLRPLLSVWEARVRWPWASYQPGNSCLQAVWHAAQRAERARQRGQVVTLLLMDFSSYFEHLRRPSLAAAATEHDFPKAPFNLSVGAYAYHRSIELYGAAVFAGFPRRGVVAGCTAATFHCLCVSANPMTHLVTHFSRATFNLHVDDLGTQTEEDSETAALENTAAIGEYIMDVTAPALGSTVAMRKLQIASSSMRVARALRHRLDPQGLSPDIEVSVTLLGADAGAGRRARQLGKKSSSALRWRAFRKRLHRICRLRKAKRAQVAQHIAGTGLLPATVYSAPVHGILEKELLTLQRVTVQIAFAAGQGKSRHRCLLLTPDRDLSAQPVVAPIHMHAVMFWKAVEGRGPVALSQLRADWADAFADGWPKKVADTRGPFGVVACSLRRVGWKATISPLLFDTGVGVINILKLGPPQVCRLDLEA